MEKVIKKGIISCPQCNLPLYAVKEQIIESDYLQGALEKIGSLRNLPKLRLDSPAYTTCPQCRCYFSIL